MDCVSLEVSEGLLPDSKGVDSSMEEEFLASRG